MLSKHGEFLVTQITVGCSSDSSTSTTNTGITQKLNEEGVTRCHQAMLPQIYIYVRMYLISIPNTEPCSPWLLASEKVDSWEALGSSKGEDQARRVSASLWVCEAWNLSAQSIQCCYQYFISYCIHLHSLLINDNIFSHMFISLHWNHWCIGRLFGLPHAMDFESWTNNTIKSPWCSMWAKIAL